MASNATTLNKARVDLHRTVCCGAPWNGPDPCCTAATKALLKFDANRRKAAQRLAPLASGQVDPWAGR